MEHLWAPWRMRYIQGGEPKEGCIFCSYRDSAEDAENLVLIRGTQALVLLNAFPYSNGHIMVSPYQHTSSLDTLSAEEMAELMELTRKSVRVLTAAYRPDGFNIGVNLGRAAGAGIADHLHMHVVPRWNGDTNFMSVLADTRVVPASLQACYDQLNQVVNGGNY